MGSERSRRLRHGAFSMGSLVLLVWIGHEWVDVNAATMALMMVLLVLMIASRWSLALAILTALAASVAYAYYFLPPVGFAVHGPQNWIALIALVVTAMIGSRLAQKARGEEEKAIRRQRDINVMFTLSRELMGLQQSASLETDIVNTVQRISGAASVGLFLLEGDRMSTAGPQPIAKWTLQELRTASELAVEGTYRADAERVALRTKKGPVGLLIVRGARLSAESVHAIGGLVAFALDARTHTDLGCTA